MKKQEFLNELRKQLAGLPKDDLDNRINFYEEMINDRMDEGLSEEEDISFTRHTVLLRGHKESSWFIFKWQNGGHIFLIFHHIHGKMRFNWYFLLHHFDI